ncbi:MAG: translation initiation factor IF-3 [Deltaproteobacteria bacterium]|nr:translation initiation factor IF-3 [Deltaproteobacteria bacterium]MBF0549778.1 translation initiation factor IF-3 [Deltaproteobacteria bacterium]
MAKTVRVNKEIKSHSVRVIGSDGAQLGILTLKDALETAARETLDLVEVSPNSDPPVCKIMDFGKYKYQQSKKTQEAKRKQTTIQIKEVKIRPGTDDHDIDFKLRHLKRFLSKKNKAKITVTFKGREIAHSEQALTLLNRMAKELEDVAVVEQSPKMEGRFMAIILAPK